MTPLASKISAEIVSAGTISFARFMELALYSPELGYYERQQNIGRRGDFYTSVSVGNLFGELLAFQFVEWLEERATAVAESESPNLQIIETGAHDGQLASDILGWIKRFRPGIFASLEYCILEPSSQRRQWQRETVSEFSGKISWAGDWESLRKPELSNAPFTICFSNELFDSMPVHRFVWDAKMHCWFECGVGWDGTHFIWKRLPENKLSADLFPQLAPELLDVLPDGFTTETCPAASTWWKEAASFLKFGKLLAIDYGLQFDEFFMPQRKEGTLRAYSQHRASSDLFAHPGEQDLTAHVNFSALKDAGENAGLKTDTLMSQSKFLAEIAGKIFSRPEAFGGWNEKHSKQFQTLIHPEHLGRSFRVLVQSR